MPAMRAALETVGINTALGGIDEIITQDWHCELLPHLFVEVKPTELIGIIGI
jgi:hypothetical protein